MSKHNFNRNFAIIIGINNYQNSIRELITAVPDALKLAEIIQKQHENLKPQYQAQNKYEVQLLLNQRASLSQLKQLIADFKQGQITLDKEKVTVTESDRLLFYFAGHGIALDALENQEGPVGYLIPQDAISGDSSTYLPMQELHDALNALPCRHLLAILDCCFAGAFRWASVKREVVRKVQIYKERYDRFISDRAWQVITSASDDQKALDSLGSRGRATDGNEVHSPFAKALFDVLLGKGGDSNQDGMVTATELYSYLRDQVEIASENYYQRQTPTLCPLRKHDKGEFIFLLPDFDRDKLEDAPPLNVENNPYRGLSSYDEKDSNLFFGREEQIQKLYQKVVDNKQQLTLVLGASGTGKSSLVKAGLIPKLRKDDKAWRILPPFRPGESPLKSLNNVLESVKQPLIQAGTSSRLFTPAEESLGNWFKNNPQAKLLVVIDQFEELITLSKSEEAEKFQIFIKNILAKYPNHIHVVITLRLDFEAQFQTSVLNDFWNDDARFVVSPMNQNEFRQAIEKPALEKVLYFDPPSLVDELINEVVQMPGALPLLSFTLSELYLKYLGDRTRDNRALTKKDYEELGRVVGSLTKRANQEYDNLVKEDSAYQDTVRRVMLRMISLQGSELARRQVPKSELVYSDREENQRVQTVIKCFSEARLIVEGSNAQGESYVEPAHDALVQGWDQLLEWKKKEEENLLLQQRLTPAAEEWQNQQQPRFLWDANPRLDLLKKVLDSDDNWLNKVETDFVQRSIARRSFNARRNWGIAITVMLGLGTGLVFSLIGQRNALINQIQASRQSAEANFQSEQELDALLASLRAGKTLKDWPWYLSLFRPERNLPFLKPDNELKPQVLQTLRKAFYVAKERNRIEVPQDFTKMFFAPDGTLQIATVGSDGIVHIQDSKGNKRSKVFSGHKGKVILDINRDSSLLASIDEQGTVRLWNLEGIQEELPKLVVSIPQSTFSKVDSSGIEFSPDGKKLVAFVKGEVKSNQKSDGISYLWDLSGNETKLLKQAQGYFSDINFNFNNQLIVATHPEFTTPIYLSDFMSGKRLANLSAAYFIADCRNSVKFYFTNDNISAAICGGAVRVKKLDDESPWKDFEPASGEEKSINFDAIGRLIVRHNYQGTISIYDSYLSEDKLQLELKGHKGKVDQLISSSNGKRFASKGDDNTIRLWDIKDKPLTQLRSIPNLTSISVSSDGKQVAVVGSDGTVRLLDLNANELKRFVDVQDKISQIIFNPVEQKLAAVGKDSTIRLLELNGKELYKSQNFEKPINQLIFSPNGQQLAFVENDNTHESTSSIYLLNLNNKPWKPLLYEFSPTYNRRGSYQSITFSSDSKSLLVAGISSFGTDRNSYSLEELESTKELANFESENLFSRISLNTKVSLLASTNGESIYLWDMSGKLLTSFKSQPTGEVTSISADGSLLATLSEDGTAILWRIGDFDELLEQGCDQVRDYLATLDENNSDRHLCNDVPPITTNPKN
ncbi:nSTAND1 domain-containing NTPase [Nostoc sp. UIC 10890]